MGFNELEETKLRIKMTRSYIIALLLIAISSSVAYLIMDKVISSGTFSAAVINTSGRQRMLSQRLSLYSTHYLDGRRDSRTKETLISTLEIFKSNHQKLSTENDQFGKPIKEVKQIYFTRKYSLDKKLNDFVATVEKVIQSNKKTNVTSLKNEIWERQEAILPLLDLVVKANQLESEHQVSRLRYAHMLILFVTLVLLVGEAIFIFKPMFNSLARLLKEAIDSRNVAIQATEAKSSYLATITHEIRNPLVGMIGITEDLLERDMSTQTKQNITTIRELSENLLHLVNEVLDYSKIEANKLSLQTIEFSPSLLLDNTESIFKSAAARKDLKLVVESEGDVLSKVLGDPTRIQQVLTNYVSNAIKFTSVGGTVKIKLKVDVNATHSDLELSVLDNGIGIEADKIEELFEPYTQENASISTTFGGTGLGLSICKKLATMMGGQVGVTSEKSAGSRFWLKVKLPLTMTKEYNIEAPFAHKSLDGFKVLVIDDDEIMRKIMAKLLHTIGITSHEASSGEEALKMISNTDYDFIFVDFEMGSLSGVDTCKFIRSFEAEFSRPNSIIFLLTAHDSESIKADAFKAGSDGFVTKPIKKAQLEKLMRESLSRRDTKLTHDTNELQVM